MHEFCSCGARLPEDARFCHKCGQPQFEEEIVREPVVWETGYNEVMVRATDKSAALKNGHKPAPAVSKLGKELRRISDAIAASGEKPLNRRELELEIKNRRTGNI